MSRGKYLHTHRLGSGRRAVHHPDGVLKGYVQRVRVEGQARPGYQPQDEQGEPLSSYEDTLYRAIEWVTER